MDESGRPPRVGPAAPWAIRRAAAADAAAAADVWLWSRRAAAEVIPAPVHTEPEIREWIATRVVAEMECWVAEAAPGALVGLLAVDGEWVDQLYVIPAWHSRGVGGALLDQAKRLHPDGLQLWTFAAHHAARRFYERRGFIAVQETDGAGNEERTPDVRYAWRGRAGRDGAATRPWPPPTAPAL